MDTEKEKEDSDENTSQEETVPNMKGGKNLRKPKQTNEAFDEKQYQKKNGKFEKSNQTLRNLTDKSNLKFMQNFDPEKSQREKRKLTRKIYTQGRKPMSLYDEKGVLVNYGKDLCDCLDEICPGCHFPCPKCRSNKCGHECRQGRKWMYEQVEIEGTDRVIKNNYK